MATPPLSSRNVGAAAEQVPGTTPPRTLSTPPGERPQRASAPKLGGHLDETDDVVVKCRELFRENPQFLMQGAPDGLDRVPLEKSSVCAVPSNTKK